MQRVRSWTVQNEMKGVLGRVSTGAAGRILDSANPENIRALTVGCVRCSLEREQSERDKGACVSKNLDETIRLQSEKKEWIPEKIRDYKELQMERVALPVWPAHQPRCSPGETSVRGPIVA